MQRRVSQIPPAGYFKPDRAFPEGMGRRRAAEDVYEEVNLFYEEAEALRLKDLQSLDQAACAERMRISRTTFARLLDSARVKVADALLNGKAIRIEGGDYEMAIRRFRCGSGHEWEVAFDSLIASPPKRCPSCKTVRIAPMAPTSGVRCRQVSLQEGAD